MYVSLRSTRIRGKLALGLLTNCCIVIQGGYLNQSESRTLHQELVYFMSYNTLCPKEEKTTSFVIVKKLKRIFVCISKSSRPSQPDAAHFGPPSGQPLQLFPSEYGSIPHQTTICRSPTNAGSAAAMWRGVLIPSRPRAAACAVSQTTFFASFGYKVQRGKKQGRFRFPSARYIRPFATFCFCKISMHLNILTKSIYHP